MVQFRYFLQVPNAYLLIIPMTRSLVVWYSNTWHNVFYYAESADQDDWDLYIWASTPKKKILCGIGFPRKRQFSTLDDFLVSIFEKIWEKLVKVLIIVVISIDTQQIFRPYSLIYYNMTMRRETRPLQIVSCTKTQWNLMTKHNL